MSWSDSCSSVVSSGNGKTKSSRISPRKTPLVNDGLTSGAARWGCWDGCVAAMRFREYRYQHGGGCADARQESIRCLDANVPGCALRIRAPERSKPSGNLLVL